MGVSEPTATFSACFGAPFMVWHPAKYAELLAEKILGCCRKAFCFMDTVLEHVCWTERIMFCQTASPVGRSNSVERGPNHWGGS